MSRPSDLPSDPERWPHGVRARYVLGCRCSECRASNVAYYHERQARAKELAAEISTPATPIEKTWTAPDGTTRRRTYTRACPGVDGEPCSIGAHLRKDSKGGVCGRCRERLVWNGLVSAAPAQRHLATLARHGVGRRAVSDACDVSDTILSDVIAGRKKRIRRRTADRILAVTADARADHALVPARATWKMVRQLLVEGYTKTAIARRLGSRSKAPALQLRRGRVLARTAHKVARVYREMMGPEV